MNSLAGLKAGNEMFRYMNSSIAFDVSSNLGCSFFGDKGTESPDIYVFTFGQGGFDFLEHGFKGYQYIHFGDIGLFCNFVDQVSLSHEFDFYSYRFSG